MHTCLFLVLFLGLATSFEERCCTPDLLAQQFRLDTALQPAPRATDRQPAAPPTVPPTDGIGKGLKPADVPAVASSAEQVAPAVADGHWTRSPGQAKAVLLLHGFKSHLREESVRRAEFHSWQQPGQPLVKELAREADVFAFAYGQDAPLAEISARSRLAATVARLRALGYREIVLLGHSAGGLIAREFVEDHPDAGVTKVIQVCAPNGGTPLAEAWVPKNQRAFVAGLTVAGRRQRLRERSALRIPSQVQFVCVVADADGTRTDDTVVPCASQWPPDLQEQRIPAVVLDAQHRQVVRSLEGARLLAGLVRQDQPRWTADRVREARPTILGPVKTGLH